MLSSADIEVVLSVSIKKATNGASLFVSSESSDGVIRMTIGVERVKDVGKEFASFVSNTLQNLAPD